MAEKRIIKRRLKRLTLMFGPDKPTHLGFTVDISDTGVFLKAIKVYPPGTILNMELSIPDNGVAEFQGKVMWAKAVPSNMIHIVKKAGMGVRIIKFLKGEKEYLNLVEMSHH